MNSPLRIGFAGFGVVGKRRRVAIEQRGDMQTVAVSDITFGDDGTLDDGTLYFKDFHRLAEQDLDALFVCLPNNIAPEATILGLEKGLHVFCEKPPGRTVEDIKSVIAVEQRHPGQLLKYGFNHRYHDSVRDALALMRSGDLGRVINMRGVYGKSKFISYGQLSDWRIDRAAAGGGILLDQGIHMVDLMRLFGGEFNDVHSFITNDYWKHDVEDNAYALMRSESGVIAMLHSTATQWRHRFSLDVTLEKGSISLTGILSGSKSYGAETMTVVWTRDDGGDPKEQTTSYNSDPSWTDEIDEFANAVLNDGTISEGSSEDALRTMELVYRIYCADPEWKAQWNLIDA
jgi:predicted dehydrogenase